MCEDDPEPELLTLVCGLGAVSDNTTISAKKLNTIATLVEIMFDSTKVRNVVLERILYSVKSITVLRRPTTPNFPTRRSSFRDVLDSVVTSRLSSS